MTHGAGRIRALLDEHGIEPSRALGQNFVIDPNTVRRIAAAAGAVDGGHVLEIGPGLGSLTLALAELGAHVVAVELDQRLAGVLREVVVEAGVDVQVVEGDARTIPLRPLLAGAPRWRLAANLPYNVGTTILLRVLADAPEIEGGVVMVQREVAERLAADPGEEAYGIPSVKARWWADLQLRGRVPAAVFHPKPRVESALVAIERHAPPGDEAERARTFALIDAGFGQRRKMLRRSLAAVLHGPGQLTAAGIAPTARAEELSIQDWLRLARVDP